MKLVAIILLLIDVAVPGKIVRLEIPDSNNEVKEADDNRFVKDETLLTSEDKKPVLDHLNGDIEEMEELTKKIDFLEEQLRKHADIHIVDGKDIAVADDKLKIYQKALKQYENNIIALKNLVSKAKHRFDDSSLEEMISSVEKAENFLKEAELSVDRAEIVEQDWEAEEESQLIQDMFALDEENFKSIESKQVNPSANISKDLQNRLFQDNWPGYPVGRGEGRLIVISAVSNESKEAMKRKYNKVIKVKKLTKQEEAKVNIIEDTKQKIDEEALADIMKDTINEDPVEHYSPEVKKALDEAAEASHKFVQEKLVQQPQEDGVLASLLPGLASLSVVCVLIGVLIFRRANKGHRSPNKMPPRGAGSPPGGRRVPEIQVEPSSASAWSHFSTSSATGTPGADKWKQK